MNKKFLVFTIILASFILYSNTVLAQLDPLWSDNSTNVTSGSTYAAGKVYDFGIVWENATNGFAVISNVTFETNMTTGSTLENITKADIGKYTTFTNDSSTGIWNISFTQEQLAGAGVYVFRWYANDTDDVWNKTDQWVYSIAQNASTQIRLFLNGTEGNRTYNATKGINITVTLNSSPEVKTVKIDTNFSGTPQLWNQGLAPLINYTTTPAVPSATYNITGYFDGDQNYTASSQTYYITVTDNDLPILSLPYGMIPPSPAAGEYGSRTVTFNCSAYDNVGLSSINISIWFTNGTRYALNSTERSGNFNYTNVTYTFDKELLRQANDTFIWNCSVNDTSGNVAQTPSRNLVIAVSDLYGYVRNSTGDLVEGVNISIYRHIEQPEGPPVEQYVTSNTTSSTGNFTIFDVNVSGQTSMFKLYFNLNNSAGNVTETGPTLPPFPRDMVFKEVPGQPTPPQMPGINGSTIYLQNAATIRLGAINSTGDAINFGYEIIDQTLGFPIKSCILCNVPTVDVVVPRDRNYTVMVVRDPQTFTWSDDCDTGLVNQTHCPTPPISNSTIYSSLFSEENDYVLNVTVNMSYSQKRLTGYINISEGQNSTAVNVTKIVPRLIPWSGFVPPMKAEVESFNLSRDLNFTKGEEEGYIAFYNISVMGSSSGIKYFIEFYGNDSSDEYFAAFRNYTIYESDKESNITLTRLAGTYIEGGDVNTSKVTVELHNSTGQNITTDAHVEVEVTHNSLYGGQPVHYIVESLTNGTFSMPFLNDSTVKLMVFSQDAAPRKVKLNLTNNVTNVTLKSFGMEFWNATTEEFQEFDVTKNAALELKFYRYNSACNVINPPVSCQLGSTHTGEFNPLDAMMAGKSNLRMRQISTNIILYFINVDLLASGPPDAQLAEQAISESSSATSFQQAWKFGSLAPDIYDYVWIGIPYSGLNESWTYTVTIPYLYDEDWNLIWNVSANGTNPGATYTEYSDYPTAWFTGVTCSKTDSTANCYMNTSSDMFWLKIPHFSGVQPMISASAPTTVTAAQPTGSVSTITKVVGKVTKTFTSIIPQSPGKIRESDLIDTDTQLTEISIAVKNRVTSVTVEVEKHDTKPSDVTVDVTTTGKVYKYMSISTSNLEENNIEEAKIKFKVAKSWIDDNDIDSATVALYRYVNDTWDELDTTKLSEDNNYVYYEAVTPGFSYFAIAGARITAGFWDIINYIDNYYNGIIDFWTLLDYISSYYGG